MIHNGNKNTQLYRRKSKPNTLLFNQIKNLYEAGKIISSLGVKIPFLKGN